MQMSRYTNDLGFASREDSDQPDQILRCPRNYYMVLRAGFGF